MNARVMILASVGLLSVGGVSAIAMAGQTSPFSSSFATLDSPYSIAFDSSSSLYGDTESYSGGVYKNIKTEEDHDVNFFLYNAKKADGKFEVLGPKGYFTNTFIPSLTYKNRLSKIRSISFEGDSGLTLYFGEGYEDMIKWSATIDLSSGVNDIPDEKDYSFFKVVNNSGADKSIISLSVHYACEYYEVGARQCTYEGTAIKGVTDPLVPFDIAVPAGITTIGGNCFSGKSWLIGAFLGEDVTELRLNCFSSCSKLTYLFIPSTLSSIPNGAYPFSGCTNLNLYCEASSAPSGWKFNWDSGLSGRVHYNATRDLRA